MNDFGVLCHQNARIIFSNSTMSKIAYFVALRRGVGLAQCPRPESGDRSPKDGGRRITFVAERRGVAG